jgi:hypothetical protein
MIRDKDAPDEVIHIRQAWIKAINRVAEAIAYRYRNDVLQEGKYVETNTGQITVIESVAALNYILVNYGEAPIKTEVREWYEKHIRDDKKKNQHDRMMQYRWWFEFMVETLNKYGMLFDTQPKGYSNVEMRSIHEDGAS